MTENVSVVGGGTMGGGIAVVAACSGFSVRVFELDPGRRTSCRADVDRQIARYVRRNLPDKSPESVQAQVEWVDSLSAVASADFVIEAIVEDEGAKTALFGQLDEATPTEIILASNTSSVSITRLAAFTSRPARVIGMHFFNPVPRMEPAEIVRGLETSDETVTATCDLARRFGKTPIVVADRPGFVVNRVLMPMISEAIRALQDSGAKAADIDQLMVLGCHHPMGPLALADLIGLDTVLSILRILHTETGDSQYIPPTRLVQMVDAGRLGKKTGRGFYDYS